jgi:hypothetical protein
MKNKSSGRKFEQDGFAHRPMIADYFFRAIRWKAAPGAGLAKVDFVKYCFQRT